jgi:hypothetical protein
MKRTILFALIVLSAATAWGQDDKFTDAMLSVFERSASAQTLDEYQEAANSFARIAVAETNEWTPLYYAALNNLMISFMDVSADQKGKLISLAKSQIEAGLKLKPEETELMVLKVLSYYAQMALNPMDAMYMLGEVNALTDHAKSVNPDNPRIYLTQAEAAYNMPPEFGGGGEAARPLLMTAMEKFNSFVPEGPLSPNWGKERCEMLLNQIDQVR